MNEVIKEDLKRIIKANIQWEKFRNSKVLITGASGMIGSYLTRTLIELNKIFNMAIEIHVLVRNPQKFPEDILENVKVIKQSVTSKIETNEKFDYIFHTASPASPLIMKEDPVGTIGANVLGAWHTLELAKESNSKGYIFISSREIYGQPYENQDRFDEQTYGLVDPLDPRSCYPEGKKAAETMCASYRQQYGLNTKIARLAHTYGPGMSIDDGRVQADFFRDVLNNRDIILKSEGLAVRTYTYIADAIKALFTILLNSPEEEIVYNISSEEATVSIKDLAQAMVNAYPERKLQLVFDLPKTNSNDGTAPFTKGVLDSSKLINLGWMADNNLEEGIKRTIKYLEE